MIDISSNNCKELDIENSSNRLQVKVWRIEKLLQELFEKFT